MLSALLGEAEGMTRTYYMRAIESKFTTPFDDRTGYLLCLIFNKKSDDYYYKPNFILLQQ